MSTDEVSVFRSYPLAVGQKIHIADGFRRGDWLVIEVGEKKVRLRCPVSGREVEWERIFFFAEEAGGEWPANL